MPIKLKLESSMVTHLIRVYSSLIIWHSVCNCIIKNFDMKRLILAAVVAVLNGCVDVDALKEEVNAVRAEYETKRNKLEPTEYYKNKQLEIGTWNFDYELCQRYNAKVRTINAKYADGKTFGLEETEKDLGCDSTKTLLDTIMKSSRFYWCSADYDKRSAKYTDHQRLMIGLRIANDISSNRQTDWCDL